MGDALGRQYESLYGTIFKNFLSVLLKATTFEKFTFTVYREILSFVPGYYASGRPQISIKSLWHAADLCKRPVTSRRSHTKKFRFVRFFLPILWGSRPEAKDWCTY
jgi:hypothetical protein